MTHTIRPTVLDGLIESAIRACPESAFAYGFENRGRYRHTIQLFAGLGLDPAPDILDAGIFPGHLAVGLRQLLGARVTGVGCRFPEGFRESMGSAGIAVVDVDLERELLPRPAASYDAVLATEILEHLWNPAFFLGELLRVLRPGGSLVLSTPNLVDLRNRLRMLAGRSPQQHLFGIGTVFRMNEWVHRREYAPAETRAMLEASGFTRVQVHTRTPTLSEGGRGLSALAAAAFNLMPGLGGTTYATAVKAPDARGPQIDRAMLSPAARDLAVARGATATIRIGIRNTGTSAWVPGSTPGSINLGAHLTDLDGRLLERDFCRVALAARVEPGEAIETLLNLVAPLEPGVYLVEADMVREGEHWFADDGSMPVRIALRVG
jgi:2-polyprenyl-3-methyl-5-hydroxy-6-metoxy-1,4-benzoquinol methylase